MEQDKSLAATSLDVVNAYGEIERPCIETAICANPYLDHLLPLFEMLYKAGAGEMWYYDEDGNFVIYSRAL